MKISVLGTEYEIVVKKYDEDEAFERCSFCGYCDGYKKEIVVCDLSTYKGWEHESKETVEIAQKETLRHEIVHAFLHESGLKGCSNVYQSGWAINEEMIDWFAIQGDRIHKAWMEADAL